MCRCSDKCPKGCGCLCHVANEETRIGSMLSLYRHARGVGVRGMAAEMGVSAPTLNRIERGKSFDLATFTKLLTWMTTKESR